MVAGKPHMVYIWFTNCPPCLKTAPLLVDLHNKYAKEGFEIVAANADRMLELPYDDAMRAAYVEKLGIEFTTAHLNTAMQNAYGGVNLFPTMFFVNKEGVVVKHFVNFQEKEVLDGAINMALR
jgi:thiol-disulfide isomerase/thioredoxin